MNKKLHFFDFLFLMTLSALLELKLVPTDCWVLVYDGTECDILMIRCTVLVVKHAMCIVKHEMCSVTWSLNIYPQNPGACLCTSSTTRTMYGIYRTNLKTLHYLYYCTKSPHCKITQIPSSNTNKDKLLYCAPSLYFKIISKTFHWNNKCQN